MEPLVVRLSDSVTIIHGDCRDVLPVECDAVVTDPPYGINYKAPTGHHKLGHLGNRKLIHGDAIPFDPSWIIDAFLKPTGGNGGQKPIILWGANHYANRLPDGQWLCWDKACGKGPHSSFQDAEFAWSSRKTPRCIFHHLWLGLLREGEDASGRARRKHPSQKPVELMLWCLETARIGLGKIVFDPYMGSGTTGIACIRTGRQFIGVETDKEYFEIARVRLENELLKVAGSTSVEVNNTGSNMAKKQ
jgi:site-specific DNA-methyltransferase (adenine-specific)